MKLFAVLFSFWVLPSPSKVSCLETFPIQGNFSEVTIVYDGNQIWDVIEICISSAGNGKNTLNLTRSNRNPSLSIYHDEIYKIIFYISSEIFEMKTSHGVFCFKTENTKTRDKIRGYFPGIPFDYKLWK